ncbi:MAG: alpha/beta fold hydrolase [Candidatus Dormibacteraeota bacterium]|uniref:Alpha/beta fold hydrolase n=1 Tax=Candidatus Aeolococcus gillhamiae TaxID=3127015 RepID=A0A934K643_9BACT|nr:alpha/beta fold hydrolase [Candidatus Dormibacteraeota bacterium]
MAAPREVEIEANGLTFETLVAGPESGETVILLHGYPQSAGSWSDTMEWLAGLGYQSIAPNLRGYSPGANPRDASEYRMTDLVADVIGIADARGVDRFHLVGHDWGGALAWSVAGDHPQRLLSLTSISTPHGAAMLEALRSSTQSLRSVYMGFFRIPRVPEAIMQFANYRQLGLSLRVTGLPSASWKRDSQQLRRVGMRGPLNWYRGATKGLRPRKISVPTLYVWGRRDPFLGRKAATLTAKYVTGPYRFEELKAGHWIPDNNTADLRRILGEHLEDFGAPAEPVRRPAAAATTATATASAAKPSSAKTEPAKAEPAKAAAKRATAKPPKAAAPKSAAKRAPRKSGSKPPS